MQGFNHPTELYGYEKLKQKLNYLYENTIRAGVVYVSWHYNIAAQ